MGKKRLVSEAAAAYGMAVADLGHPVILEQEGQPVAVVLSFEEYQKLRALVQDDELRRQKGWASLEALVGEVHARPTQVPGGENEAEIGAGRDEQATRACLLSVVVEPNDGGYLASVPDLQGAFAEGDSVEEAVFNCVDVVKLIAAYRAERGEGLGPCQVEITPDTRLTISIPVRMA